MSANPPLRLLAIDPGLAHVGIALVDVLALHQLAIVETRTVTTSPRDNFVERLDQICMDLRGWQAGDAVIEDPRAVIQSDARGRRKDPRRIADLVAAFGAILAIVSDRMPVTLAPVTRWYPRVGRILMAQGSVLARIRAQCPALVERRASEHVCMAVGLADWWSANVAPRIWFELTRQPAKVGT